MSLELLGLADDATEADVKARYRELAVAAHPDHGGSTDKFQELMDWRDQALNEVQLGQTLGQHRSRLHALREAVKGQVCPRCDGTGNRMTVQQGFRQVRFVCTLCHGKGKLS